MSNEVICCFTGHRNIEDKMWYCMPEVLRPIIRRLAESGVTTFRAGGAYGFDNYAALNVLLLKQTFPEIKLELCLPCPDQADKWPRSEQNIYHRIVKECDFFSYAEPRYVRGCMHKRNRMLVDGATYCIAFYDGKSSGGTAYTVNYAETHGVRVINLYPLILDAYKKRYETKYY